MDNTKENTISVAFEMFDRDRERDVAITAVDLTHPEDCHPQILIARVSLFMNDIF